MTRSVFVLFAIGILSSSPWTLQGFSTSRLLSSSTLKKINFRQRHQQSYPSESQQRIFGGDIVLLRVATDPTIITSNADEDNGRSYDFISVEEAEKALRRERARYEGERSELQWLLESQRQQLKDLADGRREKETSGDRSCNTRRRHHSGHGRSSASSRIVILGAHAHVDTNAMKNGKKNNKSDTNTSSRKKTNVKDETFLRMEQLENLLQDAIVENQKLARRLREQHQQNNIERSMYENELREERDRLNCIRDELHMERAYFETTRRMLEHLLDEERQKVREVEIELMMISQEQMFSKEKELLDEYEQRQRQQHDKTQQIMQEGNTQSPIYNEKRHQKEKSGRYRAHAGFTMNINDVQCPLYP